MSPTALSVQRAALEHPPTSDPDVKLSLPESAGQAGPATAPAQPSAAAAATAAAAAPSAPAPAPAASTADQLDDFEARMLLRMKQAAAARAST